MTRVRILAATLAVLIAIPAPILVTPARATPLEDAISEALREQASDRAATDAEVDTVIAEAVALEALMESETVELESRAEAAAAAADILAEREEESGRLGVEAAEIESRLAVSQGELAGIVNAHYRSGGLGLVALESVMGASSLTDAIELADAWRRIADRQSELVADIRENRDGLEQRRARLAAVSATLDLLRSQYEGEAASIEASLAEMLARHTDLLARLDELHAKEMLFQRQYMDVVLASLDASSTDTIEALRAQVVGVALDQIGDPYLWGATGPDRFDCSGLMLYSYRQVGITLPRVSQSQYYGTFRVSREDLQPGDLVFIGDGGSPDAVHHVMMYIGHGYTVESPRTGDVVKIRPLDARSPGSIAGYGSVFPPSLPLP